MLLRSGKVSRQTYDGLFPGSELPFITCLDLSKKVTRPIFVCAISLATCAIVFITFSRMSLDLALFKMASSLTRSLIFKSSKI